MTYDIVIRGGTVVDGSGGPAYRSDVAIEGGRIAAFGRIGDSAREVIDADGLVVAPGFIDGHTHMDAQVAWDPLGMNSCWNGVTSVIMGNCGFTLAPCRRGEEESLMRALEAVEDIPTGAMKAGIDWSWETYPQYLEHLDRLPKGINYGGYVGHSALRTYVMGERALEDQATADDIDAMRRQLREALYAGAIGFSTSRTRAHVTPDRRPVPSRVAGWDEVRALVGVMGELNAGIFEIAKGQYPEAIDELRQLAAETGIVVTYGLQDLGDWRGWMALLDDPAVGGRLVGQAHTRGISTIWSFLAHLPYDHQPVWRELRTRPLDEQRSALRDPKLRRRLVEATKLPPEFQTAGTEARMPTAEEYDRVVVMDSVLGQNETIGEIARREAKDPVEVVIDAALERDLQCFFMQPLYAFDRDAQREILMHPRTVVTFSDSGAHVSQVCDATLQAHFLAHWVREKQALPLEAAVRKITFELAKYWGLHDRGLLREGMAADVVVFDPETVAPEMPEVATDLPTGAKRLAQRTRGIHATIVNGETLIKDGVHTGALPGRVLRGPLPRNGAAMAAGRSSTAR